MNSDTHSEIIKTNIGFFRRFFIICYDLFLLLALLFIITAIFNALNHGKAIDSSDALYFPLVLTLLSISYLYYAWFWTHGGQTLGLKTWRGRVIDINGGNISWKQAAIRYISSLLSIVVVGLGFIWSFINKEKKTWHDILSKSKIIDLRTKK